jgi:hypothetical protein
LAFPLSLLRSSGAACGTLVGRGFQSAGLYEAVGSGPDHGNAQVSENKAESRRARGDEGILRKLISIFNDKESEQQKSSCGISTIEMEEVSK